MTSAVGDGAKLLEVLGRSKNLRRISHINRRPVVLRVDFHSAYGRRVLRKRGGDLLRLEHNVPENPFSLRR